MASTPRRSAGRGGFTLIELLVVVAIIAVMAGLLLPTISLVMSAANKTRCGSNLRQLGFAMAGYIADHEGEFPNVRVNRNLPEISENWTSQISPYADAGQDKNQDGKVAIAEWRSGKTVFRGCKLAKVTNSVHLGYAMSIFLYLPDKPGGGGLQSDGTSLWGSTFQRFYEDHITWTSNRALIAERNQDDNAWNEGVCAYRHHGLVNLLMCDFHVEALAKPRAFYAFRDPGKKP